jgi:sigma-B regulation protein RsbU (phosphoserine phosphatase)
VHQDVVRIVRPPEVLTRLHYCLCRQQLPSCQFVTGIYAVFDTVRHALRLSRAGHPYPLQITKDGAITEVTAEGGLLGLPDIDPDFEEQQVKIAPGDKIVMYTDGIEDVIIGDAGAEGEARFTEQLRAWAKLDAEHFALAVEEHLDRRAGSLNPADDITVLVIERAARPHAATD